MTTIQPQDRVLRAAFWLDDKISALTSHGRLAFLWLWAVADADGVAPYESDRVRAAAAVPIEWSPEQMAETVIAPLLRFGLVSTDYSRESEAWVWLPGIAVHQPRAGALKAERDGERPAPPHEVVVATLRIRLDREPTQGECRDASPRSYGRKRNASGAPPKGDVDLVWQAWRQRQADPDACAIGAWRGLILGALKVANAEALCRLVRYCYEADEPGPRWLQGENPHGRKYLGLDNILVASKLPGRIQMASAWMRSRRPEDPGRVSGTQSVANLSVHDGGLDLGEYVTAEERERLMGEYRSRT